MSSRWLIRPSPCRKPWMSSTSWPGVRMVSESCCPFRRMSSGSSTATWSPLRPAYSRPSRTRTVRIRLAPVTLPIPRGYPLTCGAAGGGPLRHEDGAGAGSALVGPLVPALGESLGHAELLLPAAVVLLVVAAAHGLVEPQLREAALAHGEPHQVAFRRARGIDDELDGGVRGIGDLAEAPAQPAEPDPVRRFVGLDGELEGAVHRVDHLGDRTLAGDPVLAVLAVVDEPARLTDDGEHLLAARVDQGAAHDLVRDRAAGWEEGLVGHDSAPRGRAAAASSPPGTIRTDVSPPGAHPRTGTPGRALRASGAHPLAGRAGARSARGDRRGEQVQRLLEVLLGDRREADALEHLGIGDPGPVVGQGPLGGVGAEGRELVEPLPAQRPCRRGAVLRLRDGLPADHLVLVVGGDEVVDAVVAAHGVAVHVHHELLADLVDALGVVGAAHRAGAVELMVPRRQREQVEHVL